MVGARYIFTKNDAASTPVVKKTVFTNILSSQNKLDSSLNAYACLMGKHITSPGNVSVGGVAYSDLSSPGSFLI